MATRFSMRHWRRALVACIVLAANDGALRADEAVQPATATAPVAEAPVLPAVTVHFEAAEARVGDRLIQRLGSQMDMTSRIIQSGQVAHESTNQLRRQQQRTIDVLEVSEGRAVRARASFEICRRQSPEDADPNVLAAQPIEGKTYVATRRGDELIVTDDDGRIPPLDEYTIVAESLDGVGRPNPLATILAGRDVAVGERLLVPLELAQSLLGVGAPELARLHRFELTLDRLAPAADGAPPLAVFSAVIEVKPDDEEAMTVSLRGELAVDPATCRLTSVDLSGPVHVSSLERTPLGSYHSSLSGDLKLAIRSQFAPAAE
jgi:hypothetical protein